MKKYPEWVTELRDADLVRLFGQSTLDRGRDYAAQGRVTNVIVAEKLLSAQVRGSGYRSYRTSVVHDPARGRITTICACPVGSLCKHAAALLVHARGAAGHEETAPWRRVLDPVLRTFVPDAEGSRLAIQFDEDVLGPALLPLRWGRSGRWVRTGANWNDLRYSREGFNPSQLAALNAVRETYRGFIYSASQALELRNCDPGVWSALRRAVETGVAFVGGNGPARRVVPPPELLDEPAELRFLVDGNEDGIGLVPFVRIPAGTVQFRASALLGTPAHGVWLNTGEQVWFGPLARVLSKGEQDLLGAGTMRIPASDVAVFAAGYLPRLRQRFAVEVADGVVLPQPDPPRLRCQVTYGTGSALIRWGFRYSFVGQVHDLALRPTASEPPMRDPAAEAGLAEGVPEGPWLAVDGAGHRRLADAEVTGMTLVRFVGEVLPGLLARDDVVVEQNEAAPEFREAAEGPVVSLDVSESRVGDWFDLALDVTVAGEKVPLSELLAALAAGQDHLILGTGTWFSLQVPELDRLRTLIEEARLLVDHDGEVFHLRPEHAGWWQELVELGVVRQQSRAWERAVAELLDHEGFAEALAPAGLNATLRPYQREGFAWLVLLWRTRLGGILADEMGLGKTLQALAMVQTAGEAGAIDHPVLVVAPTSVLGTWESEAARFTPDLRVVVVTETERRRGYPLEGVIRGADVVVTSYTLLRLDDEDYRANEWSAVLLDEAQFVKNHSSKVYRAVRRLRARVKIALTGTPLENNLMDLWSLLSITAPGLFPDPKRFTDAYRKPIEGGDADALARLHRRTGPLMLRRTKALVARELPDKQEQVVSVPLAPTHRKLYDRHLTRERQKVLGLVGDLNRNRITILRSLTLLRQLSLAPSLIDDGYPGTSSKIDALVEMLDEVIAGGHRALVFSQFTSFLALVRKRLTDDGIAFEYLDGRTKDRAGRVQAFRDGDAPVFLISLKAGGFGLTLTEADYVFILDPWWNPAAELQAVDRTHRIGQDKPVNVYRLVSEDTIEEKVVALQQRKRDLFDAVVGQASDVAAPLSADDIRGLLAPD